MRRLLLLLLGLVLLRQGRGFEFVIDGEWEDEAVSWRLFWTHIDPKSEQDDILCVLAKERETEGAVKCSYWMLLVLIIIITEKKT